MIKVFEPKITFSDKYHILKNLNKNYISGTSPVVNEFEELLAKEFNRKYCICVSNGSVALEVALKSLDLPKGSEIILPSFTIISCLSAVLRAGLKPIFCDVDINSWNMNIDNIKNVYTSKTKAILMVHTYGLPCDIIEIINFCKKNNIKLIEDAAEAHGLKIDNKPCGSFGDVSTFSFYANKHITTGEGGAILTNSKKSYELIKLMINLDFREPNRFNHENFYWNYRISGIQAALGISQMKSLYKTIEKKKYQGTVYNILFEELVNQNKIQIPLSSLNGTNNNYWVYGVLLRNNISREKVRKILLDNKIETRDFFWPLHKQKAFLKINKSNNFNLHNSEFLGNYGFYIPMGQHLKKKDQEYIAKNIYNILMNK